MSWYIVKKILLFLIIPGVARSKPQRQNCFLGQCNQNNIGGGRGFGGGGLGLFGNRGNFQRFPSFNPSLSIQNCVGSQCNQNNVGGAAATGGSFFGGAGGGRGSGFPSFNPSLNIQNCRGSQCGQNNFRKRREATEDQSSQRRLRPSPDDFSEGFPTRKKRDDESSQTDPALSPAVSGGESPSPGAPVKHYVCAGGLVSSTCLNSHCRIICSDGVKYDADCGRLGTSLSSSPGSPGKTVVTVTCGGVPLSFPACFPFCSGSGGGGGGGGGNQPPLANQFSYSTGCSTSSLASCISACPHTARYQACVSDCLGLCSPPQQKYNTNIGPLSPFPPCFPFCGPFLR